MKLVPIGERHPVIDAHRIGARLWQGSFPKPETMRLPISFTMLVLCAAELQEFPAIAGLRILHAPNRDDGSPLTEEQWRMAQKAASAVADEWRRGGRILITCAQGWNRSGLVSALALHRLTRLPMASIVRAIQQARPHALARQEFVDWLLRLDRHARLIPRPPFPLETLPCV